MKLVTVFLFILGLGAWLVLTDYQTVFSALTSSGESVSMSTEATAETANLLDKSNTEEAAILVAKDTASETESEITQDTTSAKGSKGQDTTTTDLSVTDDKETRPETAGGEATAQEHTVETDLSSATQLTKVQSTNPSTWNYMAYPWMTTTFNPFYWMQMMNPMVDVMTQPQSMDIMMRSMNPHLMFGMTNTNYHKNGVPDQLPVATIPGFPTQTRQNWPKNTVSESISREAKMNAFQTAMAMSPLSMRNMISMMTDKIPVADDVSWDDAVESMKLRANEVNFKFVGSSPLWKEIEAVTEQSSAKVEIFRFCDAAVARKILDEVPEFIVFLPCKIALIEDANGKLWVMTLDWDVSWMDFAQNPNNHLAKDLRADAKQIRDNIRYIMEGAATGEF